MHTLSEANLKGLIIEETGADESGSTVKLIAKCIQAINAFAKHDTTSQDSKSEQKETHPPAPGEQNPQIPPPLRQQQNGVGMNLSYTINLNLPATTEIAVFNAIFKSFKENLLSTSDGK